MRADLLPLSEFEPISLKDIGKAKLLVRIDTKFVTSAARLRELLEMANKNYAVLEIGGIRNMAYSTRYFDTPDAHMFNEHLRGKKARQKVRIRTYEDGSPLSFLEVKDKNNKGKTRKSRLELIHGIDDRIFQEFVDSHSKYNPDNLLSHIDNHFHRITLVRDDLSERITIDTDINFHNLITGTDASLPGLVVIEWKHSALSEQSPMKDYLRLLRIHESGFSKYCMGMAVTNPALKINRIKGRLRHVCKASRVSPA